jgi:hypothetical protein
MNDFLRSEDGAALIERRPVLLFSPVPDSDLGRRP